MNVISPRFVIEDDYDFERILKKIENYGRLCYKSEDKITDDSYAKFIRARIFSDGHESIIEHEKVTIRVICDRGVTHEIVRHRIGSYTQESTRYCNYSKGKFGSEITVIDPFFFAKDAQRKSINIPSIWERGEEGFSIREYESVSVNEFDVWLMAMLFDEWAYLTLINEFGRSPQEARDVLPNSLKTEIIITYNMREWRHFFKQRCSKKAHPQMREITLPLLKEFQRRIPVLFEDLTPG